MDVRGERGHGLLRLDAQDAQISAFTIGGQELWIDDVVFRGAGEPEEPQPTDRRYGDGVARLAMRHSGVRFEDYGVFAVTLQLGRSW